MITSNLRQIGNNLYEKREDGLLHFVRKVAPDAQTSMQPASQVGLLDIGSNVPERLSLVNDLLNPLAALPASMDASQRMFAPNATGMERAAAGGDMLSGMAGVLAPVAGAVRAGTSGARALMEGLLGGSPTTQAAGDVARNFVADEYGGVSLPFGANDPAAERAQGILDMLRAGRGADVTDEMLDMGDPVLNARMNEYLFANYDLPMDDASRMARAGEMGFGPALHGTGADIIAIDPNRLGEKQDVLGRGFYTTTSQNRADNYAPSIMVDGEKVYFEGANIMPLMVKESELLDLTQPTGKDLTNRISDVFGKIGFDVEVRGAGDTAFIKNPQDPKQSVMIDSYQTGQATLSRLREAFGKQNLTNIFSETGYSGLKGAEGGGRSVRINYNPEDVRARSARFDPRLAHLRNLSAGIIPIGLLSMPQNEEQY
jgi:hypothetical protein